MPTSRRATERPRKGRVRSVDRLTCGFEGSKAVPKGPLVVNLTTFPWVRACCGLPIASCQNRALFKPRVSCSVEAAPSDWVSPSRRLGYLRRRGRRRRWRFGGVAGDTDARYRRAGICWSSRVASATKAATTYVAFRSKLERATTASSCGDRRVWRSGKPSGLVEGSLGLAHGDTGPRHQPPPRSGLRARADGAIGSHADRRRTPVLLASSSTDGR